MHLRCPVCDYSAGIESTLRSGLTETEKPRAFRPHDGDMICEVCFEVVFDVNKDLHLDTDPSFADDDWDLVTEFDLPTFKRGFDDS